MILKLFSNLDDSMNLFYDSKDIQNVSGIWWGAGDLKTIENSVNSKRLSINETIRQGTCPGYSANRGRRNGAQTAKMML